MKPQLVLLIILISMIVMTVNTRRDLRINTFKVKTVTLPVEYNPFISNAKRMSTIILNSDKNIVTNMSKNWRILPKLTLTSGIRKEIGKNKNKIPTFKKLQYSRNKAINRWHTQKQFYNIKRNNHLGGKHVNISNKYMDNNNFNTIEEISTDKSFLYNTPKLEILTFKYEETHVERPRSKTTSLLYSKHSRLKYNSDTRDNISDSGENDDLKKNIFVYIPLINFEHVNKNSNSNSGRKNVVNNIRFRRDVIEEEISATTSSGFKYTAAESSLVDRLAFKNINV